VASTLSFPKTRSWQRARPKRLQTALNTKSSSPELLLEGPDPDARMLDGGGGYRAPDADARMLGGGGS